MTDGVGTILGILGIAVTVLGGFVKFLYGKIVEVETAQQRINTELRDKVTGTGGELRQSMQTQASDHRLAQNNLWTELRRVVDKFSEQHTHILESVSKLPTREEVSKLNETLSAGQLAMEMRVMASLRKEVGNR